MDLVMNVITPQLFDIPNCDPHLVEFSPDGKRVTIRGDVIIGREGGLRIKSEYVKISRRQCELRVSNHGLFGMRKRWEIVALSDVDFAVWVGGPVLRFNRKGFSGTLEEMEEERRKRGLSLQDMRYERLQLAPEMGLLITNGMSANLIVDRA